MRVLKAILSNRWINIVAVIVWLCLFFLALPFWDYHVTSLFMFGDPVPGLPTAAFLAIVLVTILVRLILAIGNGNRRSIILSVALVLATVAAPFAGRFMADEIAIRSLGPRVEQAMAAARAGQPTSKFIPATAASAYAITETFFWNTWGLAFDQSQTLDVALSQPVDKRDAAWQASVPKPMHCVGTARHIRGPWYHVNVDTYGCCDPDSDCAG